MSGWDFILGQMLVETKGAGYSEHSGLKPV